MQLRFVPIIPLVMLLAACIAPPGSNDVEVIDLEEPRQGALAIPERRLQSDGGGAVDQLLDQASLAIDQGDYERAGALVERAMRISPNDARAWFALAQVNYYLQRRALAESLLQKAQSLAVNDARLLMSIKAFGQKMSAGIY